MNLHYPKNIWVRSAWFGLLLLFSLSGAEAQAEPQMPWSFSPLKRPPIPTLKPQTWSQNPVDHFILEKLQAKNLTPSPAASKRDLLRRLFLDVHGLPPSTEDLKTLETSTSPASITELVDSLLASPRYGERWARHWIDIIHFAETHGHDDDAPREHAWPYRDYLIRSFNQDKPYSQFAQEQIAGDVLFPHDPQALIATGFLAAGPWDESSQMGIQDGTIDKLMAQYLDRDDIITTTFSTFTSLSMHCARCHDHKFDPIPQSDYYSLQAVFSGLDRVDRPYHPNPDHNYQRQLLTQQKALLQKLPEETPYPDPSLALSSVNQWSQDRQKFILQGRPLTPIQNPSSDTSTAPSSNPAESQWALADVTPSESSWRWTWNTSDTPNTPTAQQPLGSLLLEIRWNHPATSSTPPQINTIEWNYKTPETGTWTPLQISKHQGDLENLDAPLGLALDNKPETFWSPPIHQKSGLSRIYLELTPPGLKPKDASQIQMRISFSPNQPASPPPSVRLLTFSSRFSWPSLFPFGAPEAWSDLEFTLTPSNLWTQPSLVKSILAYSLDRQLQRLPTPEYVYAVSSWFSPSGNFKPALGPRTVHRLHRGNILQPKEEAVPGALSKYLNLNQKYFNTHLTTEGSRRAALALWMSDPENGLFWRSMANRVWQFHFGQGLVPTPNDFGLGGSPPSHPELLEWLACELRDHNGSLKHLHRLILSSATYQQSSHPRTEALALDANNTWYWRMTPRRLDAESIRDSLLALSQSLILRSEGPSNKQFLMSKGIHVTPVVKYNEFDPQNPANFVRSIYRFLFRTVPDPWMSSLDCPDASQWSPQRAESVGPLQALALLNHPVLIQECQRIADKITASQVNEAASSSISDWVNTLYNLILLRSPSKQELDLLIPYAQSHGLANTCRWLFNSNEAMFIP